MGEYNRPKIKVNKTLINITIQKIAIKFNMTVYFANITFYCLITAKRVQNDESSDFVSSTNESQDLITIIMDFSKIKISGI